MFIHQDFRNKENLLNKVEPLNDLFHNFSFTSILSILQRYFFILYGSISLLIVSFQKSTTPFHIHSWLFKLRGETFKLEAFVLTNKQTNKQNNKQPTKQTNKCIQTHRCIQTKLQTNIWNIIHIS